MDSQQEPQRTDTTDARGAGADGEAPFVVRTTSLGFYRQQRLILADVNLTIRKGEHWILFGPNGIGKSTLVSMMGLRQFPNLGTMETLGRPAGGVDALATRNRIALASAEVGHEVSPVEDPLDVIVSVTDNRLGRRRTAYDREQVDRAVDLMERFHIGYLIGKTMAALSEGERTRVLICRALMSDSDLMIFDEPTTGLDLGGRELILRALGELGREATDRTIVIVTHQLEEIPQGFDRIALMGRMDEERFLEYRAAHPQLYITTERNPRPGTVVYTGPLEDGLTEKRLESIFGLPLTIRHNGPHWSAFAARR